MDKIDEIIRDVAYNQDIDALMSEYLMGKNLSQNPLRDFVQYQINECKRNNLELEKEGFQIGEPWNGDILNAPILFLSSNPAFNFNEASPRYMGNGKIVMPAHENNPEEGVDLDYIKNFLRYRIQSSPAYSTRDDLGIPLKDGNVYRVNYWKNVKNRIEEILPDSIKKTWQAMVQNGEMTQRNYAQKLMKYAVCMEIVPFRSNGQFGVNQSSINYCWDKFTQKILALSGASIFVIVGNNNNAAAPMYVFDTFTEKMLGNNLADARETLKKGKEKAEEKGDVYHRNIGGKDRLIVSIGFDAGAIYTFTNHLTTKAMDELRSTFAKAI